MAAHHLQGSLSDQADEIRLGPLDGLRRTALGLGAWIDVLPGWLDGADGLFEQLADEVPWRAERRKMYDNVAQFGAAAGHDRADGPLVSNLPA